MTPLEWGSAHAGIVFAGAALLGVLIVLAAALVFDMVPRFRGRPRALFAVRSVIAGAVLAVAACILFGAAGCDDDIPRCQRVCAPRAIHELTAWGGCVCEASRPDGGR